MALQVHYGGAVATARKSTGGKAPQKPGAAGAAAADESERRGTKRPAVEDAGEPAAGL